MKSLRAYRDTKRTEAYYATGENNKFRYVVLFGTKKIVCNHRRAPLPKIWVVLTRKPTISNKYFPTIETKHCCTRSFQVVL